MLLRYCADSGCFDCRCIVKLVNKYRVFFFIKFITLALSVNYIKHRFNELLSNIHVSSGRKLQFINTSCQGDGTMAFRLCLVTGKDVVGPKFRRVDGRTALVTVRFCRNYYGIIFFKWELGLQASPLTRRSRPLFKFTTSTAE